MSFTPEMLAIVEAAAARHTSEISVATEEAELEIRKLPEFPTLVNALVRAAVRELVYAARHRVNVQIKRENGAYIREARVTGTSEAINRVYRSIYEYNIGGTTLGMLRGSDLNGIADSETARAEGHLFNAELCRSLRGMVPADQTVQDAVPERELREIFSRTRRRVSEAA